MRICPKSTAAISDISWIFASIGAHVKGPAPAQHVFEAGDEVGSCRHGSISPLDPRHSKAVLPGAALHIGATHVCGSKGDCHDPSVILPRRNAWQDQRYAPVLRALLKAAASSVYRRRGHLRDAEISVGESSVSAAAPATAPWNITELQIFRDCRTAVPKLWRNRLRGVLLQAFESGLHIKSCDALRHRVAKNEIGGLPVMQLR